VSPLRAAACGIALAAAGLAPARAEAARCVTVDRAPASTSESLAIGLRDRIAANDEAGVRKLLDTGQTMLLRGGHPVEILERRRDAGTVHFRRTGQLPLWTTEDGIACSSGGAAPEAP